MTEQNSQDFCPNYVQEFGLCCLPGLKVHRAAMASFWRTFHHDGKIRPGWWGWRVHDHHLSLYLPLCTKLFVVSALGQIHSPYFSSSPVCTLCSWKSRTLYCLKFILMYFFTCLSVCPHVWSPNRLPACHLECQSACQPICQPAYPLVLYVNLFVSPPYSKVYLFV